MDKQGGEEEEAKAYAEEQDMKKRDITKYFIDNDPTVPACLSPP